MYPNTNIDLKQALEAYQRDLYDYLMSRQDTGSQLILKAQACIDEIRRNSLN